MLGMTCKRRFTYVLATLVATVALAITASARPATIFVSSPHTPSVVYGPADMLCDLHKCRLFNLPPADGLAPDAIVEFGLPELNGQSRVDLRRCFEVCRASVLGYPSDPTSPPEHSKPTVFITPIELRLE